MPDLASITKAILAIGTPLAALIGLASRRRRLRLEIRENLALADLVQESNAMANFGLASGWLHGQIALDIAKLTGQEIGTSKKPIPWASVIWALILTVAFGTWTYWIDRDGFVWYSSFPGVVAGLFTISIIGMVTDREKSPEEQGSLPAGAVAAPTATASERVATSLAIAAAGGIDDRLAPGGQADVVLRFVKLLQLGAYAAALDLADENWLLCRLKAWLWNNREHFGNEIEALDELIETILQPLDGGPHPVLADFFRSESQQFSAHWGSINFDAYGVAGNRRRVAADLDVVILAPVGPSGGYFVIEATALPNAMSFLVRHTEAGWKVANHLGIAPPVAAWPPIWWSTVDPAIAMLPDPVADSQPTFDAAVNNSAAEDGLPSAESGEVGR